MHAQTRSISDRVLVHVYVYNLSNKQLLLLAHSDWLYMYIPMQTPDKLFLIPGFLILPIPISF